MTTIRLTSKRQATLPKKLCEQLRVQAGDRLGVYPEMVNGERVWRLKPMARAELPWVGRLRKYAQGKSHDMHEIRESIVRAAKANLR